MCVWTERPYVPEVADDVPVCLGRRDLICLWLVVSTTTRGSSTRRCLWAPRSAPLLAVGATTSLLACLRRCVEWRCMSNVLLLRLCVAPWYLAGKEGAVCGRQLGH
jgi:hypothetical protein